MAQRRSKALVLPGEYAGIDIPDTRSAAARQWITREWRREAETRSPFLWLPVAFGLGILAYFAADREPMLWAAPTLAALTLIAVFFSKGIARGLFLSLLFAALGFAAASWRTTRVESPMLVRAGLYEVVGHIEQIDAGPRRHRMTIRPASISDIKSEDLPKTIRVGAPGVSHFRSGDVVAFRARLAAPSEAAMPEGYDFRRDSYFKQIGASGYTVGNISAGNLTTQQPLDFRINALIDDWRNSLTDRIAKRIGGEAGALSAALITVKRGLIPEDTNDDLRASGLYHIVSISGLHMVLAAGIFFWIARALLAANATLALAFPIKKIAAGVAMLGATFYCLFSGSEVATERSLIMTLVMLGAILFDRPALAMRNLAISALLVLAREPEALLGPSFQMSFAAVACLIAANQIWQDWRGDERPDPKSPWRRGVLKLVIAFGAIVATTIVASIATAPFGAWHFHRINPLGVIGNALAIPLVSIVVMPSAVIGTLLVPFGLDGIVWSIMGEGVRGVLWVASAVAAMDSAVIAVPRRSEAAFLLVVAALLVFTGLRSRLRYGALAFVLVAIAFGRSAPMPDIVIDAQGRTALVRGEGGQYRLLTVASPSSFTLSQWLPALGDNRRANDPTLRHGTRCDASGCTTLLENGKRIALSNSLNAIREDCTRADLVITPLKSAPLCGEGKALFDKTHFDRFGATRLINTPNGWSKQTALNPEHVRPWRKATPTPLNSAGQD